MHWTEVVSEWKMTIFLKFETLKVTVLMIDPVDPDFV